MSLSFICDGSVKELPVKELHEFGKGGVPWKLWVEVKQCHNEDDKDGECEVIEPSEQDHISRRYTVVPRMYIRVRLRNESPEPLKFELFYLEEDGSESYFTSVELGGVMTEGCERDLYALRKDYDDIETSWLLKNIEGKSVLRLSFNNEI